MSIKHFFNVGQEKEGIVFMEFSVMCPDCEEKLVHKLEMDYLETSRLAIELVNRLGVAEELGQAFAKIVGDGEIPQVVDTDIGIIGDSKIDLSKTKH